MGASTSPRSQRPKRSSSRIYLRGDSGVGSGRTVSCTRILEYRHQCCRIRRLCCER
jgi:hypothetical protein